LRRVNKREDKRGHSLSYGKLSFTSYTCRIVIGSCMFNVVFQLIYDILIFSMDEKFKNSCDLQLGSFFAKEFVWYLSRFNACTLWILPMIYVFMPPVRCFRRGLRNLKKKLKIRDSNRRSDLNYDGETPTHESYLDTDDYSDDDDSDLDGTE
jgi:hypothetical protein